MMLLANGVRQTVMDVSYDTMPIDITIALDISLSVEGERLEQLRRELATRPFVPGPDEDPIRLTFSAGMACWPNDGADLSQLMRRADLRLSQAKLEGRNRVVLR